MLQRALWCIFCYQTTASTLKTVITDQERDQGVEYIAHYGLYTSTAMKSLARKGTNRYYVKNVNHRVVLLVKISVYFM